MIYTVIGAAVLIAIYEGPPLLKRKLWRELWVLGLMIGTAAYLVVAQMWGMTTPLNWLESLLGPVGKIIFR